MEGEVVGAGEATDTVFASPGTYKASHSFSAIFFTLEVTPSTSPTYHQYRLNTYMVGGWSVRRRRVIVSPRGGSDV